MLVPAGVLVLVILGAIAVDSAIAFLAQRELTGAAAAAANDAAAAAISDQTFYSGQPSARPGAVEIDDEAARRVVQAALESRAPARGYPHRGVGASTRPPGVRHPERRRRLPVRQGAPGPRPRHEGGGAGHGDGRRGAPRQSGGARLELLTLVRRPLSEATFAAEGNR